VLSDAEFLDRVNGFADILIKLDSLCRKPIRIHSPSPPTTQPAKLSSSRKLRTLSVRNRTSHYAFLTGKRLHHVNTDNTLRKKKTQLMPLAQIDRQLIALGLTHAQLNCTGRKRGRFDCQFWQRHTDYELYDILALARRGWLAKMLQVYPRLAGQNDEESKLLNTLYQNVERLFANHGIVLNS